MCTTDNGSFAVVADSSSARSYLKACRSNVTGEWIEDEQVWIEEPWTFKCLVKKFKYVPIACAQGNRQVAPGEMFMHKARAGTGGVAGI